MDGASVRPYIETIRFSSPSRIIKSYSHYQIPLAPLNEIMKTLTAITILSLLLSTVHGQKREPESWYGYCKMKDNICYYGMNTGGGNIVKAQAGCAWVRPLPKRNYIETCTEMKANLLLFSLIVQVLLQGGQQQMLLHRRQRHGEM